MTISRVVAALIKASFSKTPSGPVAVGSGANRRARAWLGYVGQTSLFPSSLSVGSDSLVAVGEPQTGPGSLSDNWQLYEGPLSVEGTQTVAGVLTGPTAESGGARIVLQVYQGSSGALTFGAPVFSKPESGGAGSVSRTSTVPSTTIADSVAMLGYAIGGATITADAPATMSPGIDTIEACSVMRGGEAGSTVVGVTFSSSHSAQLAAYSITEAVSTPSDLSGSAEWEPYSASGTIASLPPSTASGAASWQPYSATGSVTPRPGTVTTAPFTRNSGSRPVSLPNNALAVLTDDPDLVRLAGASGVAMGGDGRLALTDAELRVPGTSVIVVTREADGKLGVERYSIT